MKWDSGKEFIPLVRIRGPRWKPPVSVGVDTDFFLSLPFYVVVDYREKSGNLKWPFVFMIDNEVVEKNQPFEPDVQKGESLFMVKIDCMKKVANRNSR